MSTRKSADASFLMLIGLINIGSGRTFCLSENPATAATSIASSCRGGSGWLVLCREGPHPGKDMEGGEHGLEQRDAEDGAGQPRNAGLPVRGDITVGDERDQHGERELGAGVGDWARAV